MPFLCNPAALLGLQMTTSLSLVGSTSLLRSHMVELSEDHDAQMVYLVVLASSNPSCDSNTVQDVLEGTLQGHFRLIEEALGRSLHCLLIGIMCFRLMYPQQNLIVGRRCTHCEWVVCFHF
jgi:hypothetical protein